jgi:hypothetical protein
MRNRVRVSVLWFYKQAAPDGAENGRLQRPCLPGENCRCQNQFGMDDWGERHLMAESDLKKIPSGV